MPFPFHALGYSRNPFGALTDEEWTAVAILPQAICDVLPHGCRHVQVLGPKGAGKSTTLRKMAAELRAGRRRAVYEYLPEGQHYFSTNLHDVEIFCLDEVQRLNWWYLLRLVRWGGTQGRLILGSHRDLTKWFGWQRPFLTTFYLPDLITRDHWQKAITARLRYFAIKENPHTLSAEEIKQLYEKFGADMREGEYYLYEVWQKGIKDLRLTIDD
ncbi:MAG: hypothetical protein H6662_11075 [Ardenticatenaceae bacterium]|nr:hypothetical protein [Anaerolineales bacterium]MCB8922117.1 hypothetical protein [Ardenticatenaceae bacterium]MCB9003233.1 hypothetical protein [Ardenticatenaceae bacterium]